jgi:ribonuclease HI
MNLEERAVNVFTDGSSLPRPRRGGTGICIVTVDEDGQELCSRAILKSRVQSSPPVPDRALTTEEGTR